MSLTIEDLSRCAPGLDPQKYFLSWRLLLMLWKNMWNNSRTDWSRYRKTAWPMFNGWCLSAARRSRDLARFMSNFAKAADVPQVGSNDDERDFIIFLLGLAPEEQRKLLAQIRNDVAVISGLVRRYQQQQREHDQSDLFLVSDEPENLELQLDLENEDEQE